MDSVSNLPLQTRVRKKFQIGSREQWYNGTITAKRQVTKYVIHYEDDDEEEIDEDQWIADGVEVLSPSSAVKKEEPVHSPSPPATQQNDEHDNQDTIKQEYIVTPPRRKNKQQNEVTKQRDLPPSKRAKRLDSKQEKNRSGNEVRQEEDSDEDLKLSSPALKMEESDEDEGEFKEPSWRDLLPISVPTSLHDVLELMDDLAKDDSTMKPEPTFGFVHELLTHRRHGSRPGIKTRVKLRTLKKNGDSRLQWHKKGGDWSPPNRECLEEFIEVLLAIAQDFVV